VQAIDFLRKGSYAPASTETRMEIGFESRPAEVYSIQYYMIKSVSDLWQGGGFLRVLRFPPPIKLTAKI